MRRDETLIMSFGENGSLITRTRFPSQLQSELAREHVSSAIIRERSFALKLHLSSSTTRNNGKTWPLANCFQQGGYLKHRQFAEHQGLRRPKVWIKLNGNVRAVTTSRNVEHLT